MPKHNMGTIKHLRWSFCVKIVKSKMVKSSKFGVNVDNDLTEKRMAALNCLHYLNLKGKDSNFNFLMLVSRKNKSLD